MDASKFFAGFEALRRLLEQTVPCKQIGACSIAFPPDMKDAVFSVIELASDKLSHYNLMINFARIESLDEEFEAWSRQRWDQEPSLTAPKKDPEAVNGQDLFEMTLEKGWASLK